MENQSKNLIIFDQYSLIHLKTINNRDFMKNFGMIKTCLNHTDKETDTKFVLFSQINEFLDFCDKGIVKITQKTLTDLHENFVLSAAGCEMGIDNDNEKDFPFNKLVNLW